MKQISRRDFLKLGGLTLASLAFTPFLPEFTGFDDVDLVRVTHHSVSVYSNADETSQIVGTWNRDELVHVYGTVQAPTPLFNPIWYRVFGGYMHRKYLQKVSIHYNQPLQSIPDTKLLAELTVPYVQIYRYNKLDGWTTDYRVYYSTIHWITDIKTGPDGKDWYSLQDEADESTYYIPTSHLRPIQPEEISPLSPQVPAGDKRIDVNLKTQTLVCYEKDQAVLTADVSSGLFSGFDTPSGHFNIQDKLPSRRMHASDRFASDEENVLAGVPWCSFFTEQGHALHGTYWHDNFGLPMSHGCVNMRNEDAKWLFRWCTPTAGFDQINKQTLDTRGFGTAVDIHF